MIKKYSLVLIAFLCSFFYGYSQLNAGDIAFVQYNADNTDSFAFVALVDIPASEIIIFTDNEENALAGGEGTITWTAPVSGINCGTVVVITTLPSVSAGLGSVTESNNLNFAVSGDGIIAYQGTTGSPTFITALGNDGSTSGVYSGTEEGNLPSGLTLGINAQSISEIDNAIYDGTLLNGTQANLLAAIYNASNWTGSNTVNQTFSDSFTVSSCATCTDAVDFANIQFPITSPQDITVGDNFNVYARTYEPGLTDSGSPGAGIEAWIGYSSSNTNPNGSGWTWATTTFNGDFGNDDEFTAEIGSGLPTGTYYYASRFRLNGCDFTYGGAGGIWNSDSVQLNVNEDTLDFYNLQFPEVGNITTGGVFDVFGQVFEAGVTPGAGQGTGISAWIGYSTSNTDPSTWTDWVVAGYNSLCADCNSDQNDEYFVDIGAVIPSAGTYYYATRFKLNSGPYTYGGILADGSAGSTWDGVTYINGILNITPSNCSELMISEYVEGTAENKYIEVYNPTGATIDLTNYRLAIFNNSNTSPNSSVVLTGSLAAYSTYVVAHANATTYSGTIDLIHSGVTNFNGNDAIALQNASGSLNIDVVGIIGDLAFIAQNLGLIRKSTILVPSATYNDSEWDSTSVDDVSDIGSHTSDCQTPTPEIQLVDNTATNQNCGYTIDFGSQANTTNTDLTFNIENVGSADLIITSLGITAGDYTIVSPAGGFTLTSGTSQTVTVRFTPTVDGTRSGTLTINNNDSNESACTVDLTGEGYTPAPEINVEGNLGTFPDIAGDASNTPAGFNNTLFPGTPLLSSVTKSFRIQNLGTSNLTIGAISFSGAGFGDFSVSTAPSSPVTAGNFTTFEIQFTPTVVGSRVALVSIVNNDSDEDPYEFNIEGTGLCSASHSITSFAPISGPIGTEVTIIGTGFTVGSSVFFNSGVAAVIVSQTATQLVVEVPANASTGIIIVTENGCDLESSSSFTLINNAGGCTLSDLIMTEIYDNNSGSLGYIEIYNGTGSSIDLSNYYIRRYGSSQNFTDGVYTDYTFSPSVTSITNDTVLYGRISNDVNTALPDFDFTAVPAGFAGINGEDIFHLYNGSTLLDVFIVIETIKGYTATRNDNTGPNLVSNPSDWTESGTESISNLGLYVFDLLDNPSVTTQPTDVSCDADAEFEIMASPGNSGSLTYQWYYNDGTSSTWATVTGGAFPLATITGETSNTLNISNGYYNYLDYQFYCLVTEDAACSTASEAVQIDVESTTWDGSSWDNNSPDIDAIVIIDGDYDTTTSGSFEACNLIINAGNKLTVTNTKYVEVENNVIVYGDILVETQGAFIQNNDASSFTLNGGSSQVDKETSILTDWYDYTYWSSPVTNTTIGSALAFSNPNRRFWFNANNYLDLDGDDIDDNDDDWQLANTGDIMTPGKGFAATHDNIGFVSGNQYKYNFVGAFNNSIIPSPLAYNAANTNHWNLVGNPYPSAIDVDDLFTTNTLVMNKIVYMWSHYSPPLAINPGNEVLNFNQNDYVIINETGTVGNGNDLNNDGMVDGLDIPGRYIPSGQSFFVSSLAANDLIFNNSMRITGDNNNDLFFRSNEIRNSKEILNQRFWLNLTSDNGLFSSMLVGYINGATNKDDGLGYDAYRISSIPKSVSIYTKINGVKDKEFVILGKAPNSLKSNEVIKVGFRTDVKVPTLYKFTVPKFEGSFFEANDIYLKDNLLGKVHNLLDSDYVFTSEAGEFNKRFQIVFKSKSKPFEKTSENINFTNTLKIIEHNNGNIEFSLNSYFEFKKITIIDFQGKIIYNLATNGHSRTFNLSNLNQATYIARVELSNGSIITKKLIKRK